MTKKTAVSLPDDVFEDADRLAADLKLTRSEVYARALREYIQNRTADDPVTQALNEIHSDPAVQREQLEAAEVSVEDARDAIARGDWEW